MSDDSEVEEIVFPSRQDTRQWVGMESSGVGAWTNFQLAVRSEVAEVAPERWDAPTDWGPATNPWGGVDSVPESGVHRPSSERPRRGRSGSQRRGRSQSQWRKWWDGHYVWEDGVRRWRSWQEADRLSEQQEADPAPKAKAKAKPSVGPKLAARVEAMEEKVDEQSERLAGLEAEVEDLKTKVAEVNELKEQLAALQILMQERSRWVRAHSRQRQRYKQLLHLNITPLT